MILTPDNEYAAVLDACVLIPMPLCDTLLRLEEEPATYRPLWSEPLLQEVGDGIQNKLGYTGEQRDRRISKMRAAFPEAVVTIPDGFCDGLTGLPDANDRHVLAAAILGSAHVIVTQNDRHFPADYLQKYHVLCHRPDTFLVHQFHLCPELVLEKLDAQATAKQKERGEIINRLRTMVPQFCKLGEQWNP